MNDRVMFGFAEGGIPTADGRMLSLGQLEQADRRAAEEYSVARIHACAQTRFNGDLKAAADFMGPGAIELPRFESQILDMVRRRGILGQRIKAVPATGQPSRFFEQRTIISGTWSDPRAITSTAGTPLRSERAVNLKAISGAVNFGLFDSEVTRNQGMFSQLIAKDVEDMVTGMLRTSDIALWNGSDTDISLPTTNQYVGALTQINRTFGVASGVSIVDAIKAEVASIMSNASFEARPTAIYCHPQTLDLIEQEERLNHRQMPMLDATNRDNAVIGGLKVTGLTTAAGVLPLISAWELPAPVASVSEPGKTDYTLVILSEELCEYHYLTTMDPRVFVLGLQNNLATQYVAVMFGAPVFKGKAATNSPESGAVTYAHSVGTITR